MQIDNGGEAVRLVIDGLFDGATKRVGDQVAFVAQAARPKTGVFFGKLDGDRVRLMVAFVRGQERARPPMMIATILP